MHETFSGGTTGGADAVQIGQSIRAVVSYAPGSTDGHAATVFTIDLADGTLDDSYGAGGATGLRLSEDEPTVLNGSALTPSGGLRVAIGWDEQVNAPTVPPSELVELDVGGTLDTTVGDGGHVFVHPQLPGYARVVRVDTKADGSSVMGSVVAGGQGGLLIGRLDPAGQPVGGFGTDGQVVLLAPGRHLSSTLEDVVLLPDDRVAVLSTDSHLLDGAEEHHLTLLTAAGAVDPGFGTAGDLDVTTSFGGQNIAMAQRLTVSGTGPTTALHASFSEWLTPRLAFLRVPLSTGQLDPTYGDADGTIDARASIVPDGGGSLPSDSDAAIAGASDGSVWWAGPGWSSSAAFTAGRLTPAGGPDPTFSGDGMTLVPPATPGDSDVVPLRIQPLPSGGAMVLSDRRIWSSIERRATASQLTAAGTPDPAFNTDGLAEVTAPLDFPIVDARVQDGRPLFSSTVSAITVPSSCG